MKPEGVYTIPLRDAFKAPKTRRAKKAVKLVKRFLTDSLKSKDVKLDVSLNNALWRGGIGKPPARIRVRVSKEEDNLIARLVE